MLRNRTRTLRKKGAILRCYRDPLEETRVICMDEMGSIAVKTYPGEEWLVGPTAPPSDRAVVETIAFVGAQRPPF